ncbi:MAG TPA: hypothetical protein VMU87_20985 [Stellaceae bacterium]|nr:hypothetical protein [Stellaceae bacterium]
MVTNGFYSIVFGGAIGSGLGLIALQDGKLTGVDGGGGQYDGTYREDPATGTIALRLEVLIPAHMPLVTGAAARPTPWTLQIETTLKPNFAGGLPISIATPSGPISVTFTLLRAL